MLGREGRRGVIGAAKSQGRGVEGILYSRQLGRGELHRRTRLHTEGSQFILGSVISGISGGSGREAHPSIHAMPRHCLGRVVIVVIVAIVVVVVVVSCWGGGRRYGATGLPLRGLAWMD